MTIKLKNWIRFQVAASMLMLFLGWIAVPLSLASIEPLVCEMECCIAEGHCCCAARRPYVKGHEPKPGVVSLTVESILTDSCPAGCVASGISVKNNLLRVTQAQAPLVTLESISREHYQSPFLLDHQFADQPSSPRAPPNCDRPIA
jgi:hypothetical protein